MQWFCVLMGLLNKEKMERETGIEPATSSLGSWHSTAELLPLVPASPKGGAAALNIVGPLPACKGSAGKPVPSSGPLPERRWLR